MFTIVQCMGGYLRPCRGCHTNGQPFVHRPWLDLDDIITVKDKEVVRWISVC